MNNDKKVTKVQKYTIDVIHYDDGMTEMKRTNEGFSVFGLIGILSHVLRHLHSIVYENYKPMDFTTQKHLIWQKSITTKPTERRHPMASENAEDLDNYYKWRNGCIVKLIAYPVILGIIVMIIYASILLSKEKHIEWTKEAINQQKQKETTK